MHRRRALSFSRGGICCNSNICCSCSCSWYIRWYVSRCSRSDWSCPNCIRRASRCVCSLLDAAARVSLTTCNRSRSSQHIRSAMSPRKLQLVSTLSASSSRSNRGEKQVAKVTVDATRKLCSRTVFVDRNDDSRCRFRARLHTQPCDVSRC